MVIPDYAPQIVWLVITFVCLYVLMARLALPQVAELLEDRRRRLTTDLEQAASLRDEAAKALVAYEAAMAEARLEAEAAIGVARERIQADTAARIADLAARLDRQAGEHGAAVAAAKTEAMDHLRAAAATAARASVAKLIGVEVADDAADAAVEAEFKGLG
jgi:F-type H+-transporting ATPase subunit b